MFANVATLVHFVGYRGFTLNESQIRKYAGAKDPAMLAASLGRRPFDNSRHVNSQGAGKAAPRRFPTPGERWSDCCIGTEISFDALGPYGQAYGGLSKMILAVDPFMHPPFALGFPAVAKSKKDVRSNEPPIIQEALSSIVKEYEVNGHHRPVWNEPIKVARADYGADFISAETQRQFRDFCIEQMWSTPYAHEQNGVVENYVKQLFVHVAACYASASWAPRILWMYCIIHVIQVLNLHVGGEGEGCSHEAFYKRRFDFLTHTLLPWGCVVLAHVPKHLRSWKFGEHGIPGVYIGYPRGIKQGIYVYIPLTGKVRIVREYSILETPPAEWPRYNSQKFPSERKEETDLAGQSQRPSPLDDVYLEEDLEQLLNEAGELDSVEVDPFQQREEPHLKEVETLAAESSNNNATAVDGVDLVGGDGDMLIRRDHRSLTPWEQHTPVRVVPTTYMPPEVENNFLRHHSAEVETAAFIEEVRYPPAEISPSGSQAVGDGVEAPQQAAAAAGEATPWKQQPPVEPPPVMRKHTGEYRTAADAGIAAPTVGLSPADGAGQILPPPAEGVEGTVLTFEEVRVNTLLPSCPELAYVIIVDDGYATSVRRPSGPAIALRAGSRRGSSITLAHLRGVRENVASRDSERRAWKRARLAAVAKAKKKFSKRSNPDKPSLYTALRGQYRQQVLDAMELEISQYTETFEAIQILSDELRRSMTKEEVKAALTSHFEIEFKRDTVTKALIKVKARLVIHGNQVSKYSFDDIKSPTVRPAAVKLLISMLAKRTKAGKSFRARSWDVKGAFLQNNILKRTRAKKARDPGYVEPPPILLRFPDGRIGKLNAYVYGLKQASYEWYECMRDVLLTAGYVPTDDPCLFKLEDGLDNIFICVHVDDVFAIATSDHLHDQLDQVLESAFVKNADSPLARHVGDDLVYLKLRIRVSRTSDGVVTSVRVDQTSYIDKLVSEWGYKKNKHGVSLIDENDTTEVTHPIQGTYAPHERDDEPIDSTWYRGVVGAINYAAGMTRPDLLFAMSVLAEHCNAPTRLQWRMVKRTVKYLRDTSDRALVFDGDDDWRLTVYADASYASRTGAKSQSGYCMSLGLTNAVFYAKSQKQNLVTLSSTEAEYVALHHAATEVVYLRRLLASLGYEQTEPTVIWQDNQSTMLWARGQRNHNRTKHLDVKYHYISELIQDGLVELKYMPTTEMIADLLTKPLINEMFTELTDHMLGNSM